MEELGVGCRIILKWILRNRMEECGLALSGLGLGKVANTCESDSETSGCIKFGEYLGWVRHYWVIKDSSP